MKGRLTAVVIGVVACPLAMSGWAHADPVDSMTDGQKGQLLFQVLRDEGIPTTDAKQTMLMAQVMCFSLKRGQSAPSVIADVASMSGWSNSDASFFYGAGTAAFCPELNPATS